MCPLRARPSGRPAADENLLGSDRWRRPAPDLLPGLETAEERALRGFQRAGRIEVEAARPGVFGQAVAVRGHAVLDRESEDPVVAPVDSLARTKLAEVDVVGQLPEDPLQHREEVDDPRWPVNRERQLPPAQRERLQHPGQSEVVVGVVMREEDVGKLDEADRRAQELTLRSLAAIEQDPVSAAADQCAREPTPSRGHRARGSEEDDVEVHGGQV